MNENHRCDPSHIKTCTECGDEYHRRPNWRTHEQRYCSNPCRLIALNRDQMRPRVDVGAPQLTRKGYIRRHVWRGDEVCQMLEHRYVMEQVIGRPLTAAERVHHIDGDRTNNDPANLLLFATQAEHIRAMHPEHFRNLPGRKVRSEDERLARRRAQRAARNEAGTYTAIPLAA